MHYSHAEQWYLFATGGYIGRYVQYRDTYGGGTHGVDYRSTQLSIVGPRCRWSLAVAVRHCPCRFNEGFTPKCTKPYRIDQAVQTVTSVQRVSSRWDSMSSSIRLWTVYQLLTKVAGIQRLCTGPPSVGLVGTPGVYAAFLPKVYQTVRNVTVSNSVRQVSLSVGTGPLSGSSARFRPV